MGNQQPRPCKMGKVQRLSKPHSFRMEGSRVGKVIKLYPKQEVIFATSIHKAYLYNQNYEHT
jgi:hypothetical protein